MIENALGLFVTVVFLTFLLLGIGINSTWSSGFKVGVIVVSTGVMIGCYFSIVRLLGWPSPFYAGDRDLVLIHAVVEEPGKFRATEGSIYLWVRSNTGGSTPRALRFPYRRELHEKIAAALQSKNDGLRQGIHVTGSYSGSVQNESFSVFDMHKPALTDKGQREN